MFRGPKFKLKKFHNKRLINMVNFKSMNCNSLIWPEKYISLTNTPLKAIIEASK